MPLNMDIFPLRSSLLIRVSCPQTALSIGKIPSRECQTSLPVALIRMFAQGASVFSQLCIELTLVSYGGNIFVPFGSPLAILCVEIHVNTGDTAGAVASWLCMDIFRLQFLASPEAQAWRALSTHG